MTANHSSTLANGLLAAFLALSSVTCAAEPVEIPIVLSDTAQPTDARSIADYRSALDAILRVITGKYGLPVPQHTLLIYSTREELEAGLMLHLGLKPALAASTAS